MRKIFFAVLIIGLIGLFIGCEEEPSGSLNPPTNLQISAGSDGLTLNLTWTAPSGEEVENYIVYRDNIAISEPTATSLALVQGDAAVLGDYKVTAVIDGDETDATSTVSTDVETGTTPNIYSMNAPPGYDSGFGWDQNGDGYSYSMASSMEATNSQYVHLYLDGSYDLNSADVTWSSGKTTYLVQVGSVTYAELDTTARNLSSYASSVSGDAGTVFYGAVEVNSQTYYFKAKVTEEGTDSGYGYRKCEYKFQTIPDFRRVDTD